MRRWLVVVLLGGCALPVPPNVDRDNDLRRDRDDNCPDLANPDQSDFDGDGIGDLCDVCDDGGQNDVDDDGIPDGCDGCIGSGVDIDLDGIDDACDDDACVPVPNDTDNDGDGIADSCDDCPFGPPHDEDHDGISDACDNCPSVGNPGQENTLDKAITDMVGDACDAFPGNVDTYVFTPFVTADPALYLQGGGITVANDALRIASPTMPAYVVYPDVLYTQQIAIRTRMAPSAPAIAGSGTAQGILLSSTLAQPAADSITCFVAGDATNPEVFATVTIGGKAYPFAQTAAAGPPPWELVVTFDPATSTLTCGVANRPGISVSGPSDVPAMPYYAGVYAQSGGTLFNYFWALD